MLHPLLRCLALACAVALTGCLIHSGESYGPHETWLTIENDSAYRIDEIYVSPAADRHWGRDLLGRGVLHPGDDIHIELECDVYDVMIVDEDDWECIVDDWDLCFDDAVWRITNRTLERCD